MDLPRSLVAALVHGDVATWVALAFAAALIGIVATVLFQDLVRRHIGACLLVVGLLIGSGGAFITAGVSVAGAPDGCTIPPGVTWDPNGGHDAWPDPTLKVDVPPCSTLMITGLTVDTPAGHCQGNPTEVCVAIWHPSKVVTTASVSGLTPGHTWRGTT